MDAFNRVEVRSRAEPEEYVADEDVRIAIAQHLLHSFTAPPSVHFRSLVSN